MRLEAQEPPSGELIIHSYFSNRPFFKGIITLLSSSSSLQPHPSSLFRKIFRILVNHLSDPCI